MKKVFMLAAAVVLTVVCGCRTQIVTLDVVPADARVIANGVEYNNKSPIFIETSTGKQLMITAYKEGYQDKIYVIDYSLSSLGKVYAWTSILVLPAFGLLFDNAWQLNQNNVVLTLDPITPAARAEALTSVQRITMPSNPGASQPKAMPKSSSAPAGVVTPAPYNPHGMDQTTDPKAKKIFNQL